VFLFFEGTDAEMMVEEIIAEIVVKRPEVSRGKILERLEREKKRTGGFISEETLLRMIAAELGVEVSGTEASTLSLSLVNLIPSLNDVTVTGRVVAVFSAKTFEGNRSGKLASLLIADGSGILRVVFWDDKTDLVESGEMKVGKIIRVSHGYTRESRGGRVELHVGDKGEVEINPPDVKAEDYPDISRFTTKIGKISQAYVNREANIGGAVKEIFPSSNFRRQDLSSGKVMRLTLADETGEIPTVVWNDKAEELENTVKKELWLQLVNAKVKKAAGGGLEVHVDSGTFFEVLAPREKLLKIADLREDLNRVSLEGEVATKPMSRDVKTSSGEHVRLAVFELKDETGRIWVSAWRRHADCVKDFKVGHRIVIKNAHVKKGFSDQLEISTRDTTSIAVHKATD
jgi:replication factor A1